ncbi:hypothetical protein [Weissella paramesenteroides]|nr:hypothetical protein [Weissella paramesenteroides]RZQ57923.1 hypothetical protein EWR19_02115 [Weissella paramesenteroides]
MKEFDKYLVPEQLEQKKYRFGNGYGALVTYYRPTNTYDLHPIKWIGEQNIFIDESCINTTSKKEDIVAALNEIKNKRGSND